MVFPCLSKMTWKYQQPPSGRTGDSTPWLLPLMTLIFTPPSGPSGNAVAILQGRGREFETTPARRERNNALFGAQLLVGGLDHFELLRQVYPELEAAWFRDFGALHGHLCVYDWQQKVVRLRG